MSAQRWARRRGGASGVGLLAPGRLSIVVVVLLLGGLLWFIGSLRYGPVEATLVVLLAALVVALAVPLLTTAGQHVDRAWWVSTPRVESAPPAALDYRLLLLRRNLRDAVERDDRPDTIYPVLRELTAERLRSNHDVDLDTEPERAQQLLDPQLWRYLTRPPTGTEKRSRSALHTAIEGIEKL